MTTEIESVVELPIVHPQTGLVARRKFMGKVDRVEDNRIIDWKGVAKPSRFIAQLRIGYQVELYALALKEAGVLINEVQYRLITRPTIKLCGKDADKESFEERCLAWLIDDPQKLTQHDYPISSKKMDQARWYLWESSRRLLENGRNNRWIPNTNACYAWERECPMMALCETVQAGGDLEWVIDSNYRVLHDSHPELPSLTPSNVVTYSSLSDLHLCEMLYFWKHHRRLRKGTDEHSEALWIGSAMHAGMEKIDQGEEAALAAVNEWAKGNPVLGENAAHKQDQEVSRARAMVRAAAIKWPINEDGNAE